LIKKNKNKNKNKNKDLQHIIYSLVHRQIMMNSVHQKVQCNKSRGIWQQTIDMEKESVHGIFQYCPDQGSEEETSHNLEIRFHRDGRDIR
jgi:hypothetical protein